MMNDSRNESSHLVSLFVSFSIHLRRQPIYYRGSGSNTDTKKGRRERSHQRSLIFLPRLEVVDLQHVHYVDLLAITVIYAQLSNNFHIWLVIAIYLRSNRIMTGRLLYCGARRSCRIRLTSGILIGEYITDVPPPNDAPPLIGLRTL